jgi:hypothetical protein
LNCPQRTNSSHLQPSIMLRERIFPPHTIPSSVQCEQKETEKRPACFFFSEAGGVQQFYRVVGWVALTCDPPGATKDVTRPAPEAGKNAKILPRRMMIKETPPAVRLSVCLPIIRLVSLFHPASKLQQLPHQCTRVFRTSSLSSPYPYPVPYHIL